MHFASTFVLLAGGFLAAFAFLSANGPLVGVPAALGALLAAAVLARTIPQLFKNALGEGPFLADVAYFFWGKLFLLAALSLIDGLAQMAAMAMGARLAFETNNPAATILFGALCLPLAARMVWRNRTHPRNLP